MSHQEKEPASEPSIPAAVRPAYEAIVSLIDPFCREHLNDEYRVLCRRLAGVLARKRPSPLVRGKPEAWAAGVVRVIGWVNFLDDSSQTPHMKMAAIDQAFVVSPATGAAKSRAIRDLVSMRPFDPEWTLPSRMGDNPLAWMIQVNGLLVDARHMPREIQEEAYRKGLIPYIPDEGPDDPPDEAAVEEEASAGDMSPSASADTACLVAELHLRKGEYDKAIEAFTRAIETNPTVDAYQGRAKAYRALADMDEQQARERGVRG